MPTTEMLGRLKVQVVEAKGLTIRNPDQAKPYVLLQYDRTDSISRAYGETASTNSSPTMVQDQQEKEKDAKKKGGSAIRRVKSTNDEASEPKPQGITVRRKVGPTSTTSHSASSSSRTSNGTTDSTPSLWKATGGTLSSKGTFSTPSSSSQSTSTSSATYSSPRTSATSVSDGSSSPPLPSSSDSPTLPPPSQIGTPSSPIWSHSTTFDVVSRNRTILICIYDKNASLTSSTSSSSSTDPNNYIHGFLGASVFEPPLLTEEEEGEGKELDVWVPLTSALDDSIGGEIRIKMLFEPLKVCHSCFHELLDELLI